MAAAVDFPGLNVPLYCFRLQQAAAITASGDSLVTYEVPFNCTAILVKAGVDEIDDATDVDIDVEVGTTDLTSAVMAVADSSAIVSGGVEVAPLAAAATLTAGDVLHLDVDVTGGTSPTIEGCWAEVWVTRRPD